MNSLLNTSPVSAENDSAIALVDVKTVDKPTQSTLNKQSNYSLDNYTTDAALSRLVAPERVASSGDYQIDALLTGSSWDSPSTISYSFLTSDAASSYYGSETVSELSGAVIGNVRTIIENVIEPLIDVNFVEVADSASSYGQIRYMFSNEAGYAYAYDPFSSTNPLAGDVHLSPDFESDSVNGFSGNPGSYGFETLIHETFHALGLKHPGDYNGDGTEDPPFLPFGEDVNTNTVMTYNFGGDLAATAMPYDIKALQYIYGAKTYNAENTTYSFNSVYGYTANGQSEGSSTTPMKLTIWDSGGTDTLDFSDLSNSTSGYRFDLREGGINTTQSAYNGTSYTAVGDTSGSRYLTSTNGTAIAYNMVIENATGSSSNDTIFGNSVSNFLQSQDGDDKILGGDGDDTLRGEVGNDSLDGGVGIDTLTGGLGNDILVGGTDNDRLTGGKGADRFVFDSKTEGTDIIKDFSVVNDTIYVSAGGFGGELTANAAITADQFKLGSAAGDSSDRFIYNKNTGNLFFDVDGKGGTKQLQFATLSDDLAMTQSDIFVTV